MDETRYPVDGAHEPYRGPHWRHERPPGEDGIPPLRLILQGSGWVVELTRSDMVFGRRTDADVRLPLPDVSRLHCQFVHRAGNWHVIDLNSLNGVQVNEVFIREARLRHRDLVRIGGFTFEVDLKGGEATVDLGSAEHHESAEILRSIVEALPRDLEDLPPRRAS